jgi:hypothetical protein
MDNLTATVSAVVHAPAPLTSRQLAEAVGIDYRRNFNKREAKYARKLAGFVVRRRLTPGEVAHWPADRPAPNARLLHWVRADAWLESSPGDIVRAFEAHV